MSERQSRLSGQNYIQMADSNSQVSDLSRPETDEKAVQEVVAPAGPPAAGPPAPPDGGFTAWLQVVGGFFLIFNAWGIVNTFGVFQTYYETTLLQNKSPSDIAWIGSIEAFLLLTVSVVAGPAYDYGYLRTLIGVGSFLMVFGMMMLSLCDQYWQVMLTQGLLVGAGSGFLFLPSMAIIPTYFAKRRAVATGIAMSGSGLGGIIYPIIFRQLQPSIGFGWATRVIGFIMLATLVVPIVGMKMRVKPPGVRRMVELEAWKELPYSLVGIGAFFAFAGLYIPMFFIQSYALEFNLADENLAFYILPILNAASVVGRILPNLITDKIGTINVYASSGLVVSIVAFTWMSVHNLGGLITFAVFYGFFSGTFLSLAPVACMVLVIPKMHLIGVRLGMNFFVGALGLLIGTPVAGVILKSSWTGLQAFNGATLLLGTACFFGIKFSKSGWNVMEKL